MNHVTGQSPDRTADKWDETLFVALLLQFGMPPEWELGEGYPSARIEWKGDVRAWLWHAGVGENTDSGCERTNCIHAFVAWCKELRRQGHGTMH